MNRKSKFLLVLILISWVFPIFPVQSVLKIKDIPKVVERFFNLHIENKEWTPALVRRSMKLYIEQFDPDKAYLLESEIAHYLNMGDARVHEVMLRLKQHDYSDFIELNQVIQNAIVRAQGYRNDLAAALAQQDGGEIVSQGLPAQYASAHADLMTRQKSRMLRFYSFHKGRSRLDSQERRKKVYALFEKKVRRLEHSYLFLRSDGTAMEREAIEHVLSLRIIKSFAKSLDTHTSFFSPEEAYEMRLSLEKQFEGVGVILSEGIDGIMIAELIQGSPAEQSGKIQINDILVDIDGKDIRALSLEEVLDLLKKRDRGEILLGFFRLDPQTQKEVSFRVPLHKRPIVMNDERIQTSVEHVEGGGVIGKISLHSFYESSDGVTSEKDIKEAIRSFRQQGELVGLVLDLRENSGGFLSQAVRVAGLFVSNGVIVISKYGKGDVHYLRNIVGKSFFNGPIVVLTSKMSASAAEIVAQALQDYGVALVVGDERTFGKGSIQYQTVTDERAELFFKITVGRYYTVSGKSTQINGVAADIVVPSQYAPYNIGEKFLEYPLPADQMEPAYIDPLSDLDEKTRHIFQTRYLPFLQRVVPFWKKMLPTLRKNSAQRMANDPQFQAFLKRQEKIRARQAGLPVNTIDEPIQTNSDLQMIEAVNVVKDMIHLEGQTRGATAAFEELSKTGSD